MEIAFCTFVSLSHYGGIEIWIIELAKLLAQRGHKIRIYTPPYSRGERKVKPETVLSGIPYQEAWHNKVEADVAYIMYYSPLLWRMLFSVKCPRIAGIHAAGLLHNKYSLRHQLFRMMGSQDLASFGAVHTISRAFQFEHAKVFHIPIGIDGEAFRPQVKEVDKFTLLFVGRRHRERGWDTFLEVAFNLKAQGYDFDFIATGQQNELVRGLGSVSHEDMPEVCSRAHMLVHPSKADVFSRAILEMLSCGLPVVTTPIEAHTSMGLPLFYAQTPTEFIQQTLKIYEGWRYDSKWYQELRYSLRESVLRYDINGIFPQLESMFESVASRGRTVK
ncbi:hypothetical protein ES707_15020 [subsurface metagenome]